MARVDINGNVVEFPDSLSEEELNQAVSSAATQLGTQDKRSLPVKAWQALRKPEEMSRAGLQMLANYVPKPEPTGNLPLDLIKGTPRVAADTIAEAAPGFISRGALVTAGALRGAQSIAPELAAIGKPMLRAIGSQAEEMSGIAPRAAGSLEAAYKDPSLIFSKGKQAAGQFYEAAKDELNSASHAFRPTSINPEGVVNMEKTGDILSGMYKPMEILDKANEFIRGGGKLEPAEALKVRKAIDVLLKSKQSMPDELYKMRDEFDAMAKASSNIATGDETYVRGMRAQALRNLFPQNKYGGASAFKTMLLKLTGGMAAPLLSPVVQGGAATAAGVVSRAAEPLMQPRMVALLSALARRKEKSNAQ